MVFSKTGLWSAPPERRFGFDASAHAEYGTRLTETVFPSSKRGKGQRCRAGEAPLDRFQVELLEVGVSEHPDEEGRDQRHKGRLVGVGRLQQHRRIGKRRAPVTRLRFQPLARQPFALPGGIVWILQLERGQRVVQALAEGRDPGDLTTIDDPSTLEQIKASLAS